MSKKNSCCKKAISSEKLWKQVLGAMFQWRPKAFLLFVIIVMPISFGVSFIFSSDDFPVCLFLRNYNLVPGIILILLNLMVWMTIKVCRTLIGVFSLRKKETSITNCYVSILLVFGLWIIGFVLLFNIKEHARVAAAIGIIGTILSIIFQDRIKGMVAFFHLRQHHLLKIGDWIEVPKYNVDGMVKSLSLTSVSIYNWDTTTSVIPISVLHSEHFKNYQNMTDGKTYGRQMLKTFILDTSWFRPLSLDEINKIKALVEERDGAEAQDESKKDSIFMNLSADELQNGVLNAQLFRLYIYHWLMNREHVSQHPRLVVRWMQQVEGGMPLQVYAFIVDGSLPAFEWQQSQIIEHIVESLDWFGLRLYQSPSAFDVSNSNIHLTDEAATYRKEIDHE